MTTPHHHWFRGVLALCVTAVVALAVWWVVSHWGLVAGWPSDLRHLVTSLLGGAR